MTTYRPQVSWADRAGFAEHAAPQAIEVHLRAAQAAQRAAERDVKWLSALLARRTDAIAAGTWPPGSAETGSVVPAATPDGPGGAEGESGLRHIDRLIEASSLGTPEAKALRASVPEDVARAIVARSKELGADDLEEA